MKADEVLLFTNLRADKILVPHNVILLYKIERTRLPLHFIKNLELTASDLALLLMEEMLRVVESEENIIFLQLISMRNFISSDKLHLFKSSGERKRKTRRKY